MDLAKKHRRRLSVQGRRIWTTTGLTCAASQSVHMFSIYEIFHGIHLPLNFLFIFRGINLILVNIKLV